MLEPTLDTLPPHSRSDHQYSWKKISELPRLDLNGKMKAVVSMVSLGVTLWSLTVVLSTCCWTDPMPKLVLLHWHLCEDR